MTRTTWIFGYGSLVWRPDFPATRDHPALLRGWARRFWQQSVDHRGVPGAPGRVATLVRDPASEVWGRVYEVDPRARDRVLAALDHRERGGYERHLVQVETRRGTTLDDVLVYVATERNRNYVGPAPVDQIAEQIRRARGPSGPNDEYLFKLAEALRDMGVHDPHVFDLEAAVRR